MIIIIITLRCVIQSPSIFSWVSPILTMIKCNLVDGIYCHLWYFCCSCFECFSCLDDVINLFEKILSDNCLQRKHKNKNPKLVHLSQYIIMHAQYFIPASTCPLALVYCYIFSCWKIAGRLYGWKRSGYVWRKPPLRASIVMESRSRIELGWYPDLNSLFMRNSFSSFAFFSLIVRSYSFLQPKAQIKLGGHLILSSYLLFSSGA